MKKEEWIRSYKDIKPPHWAVLSEPSKSVLEFLKVLQEKNLKGTVLEVGCGNGRDSIYLARQGYEVVGVDIAPEAIKLSQKNKERLLKDKDLAGNLNCEVADVENLPFPNEHFTGVYSIGVLHNTNLQKSLKEVARVLKKGGLAIIHLYQKTLFLKPQRLEKIYSPKKAKSILKKLPFKILNFTSDITTNKIDYDDKTSHKHFAMVMQLEKL
jgi:ubiquinone/menaquinone biosynthesis C-methylase UbiE